jgi:hypothetical protein
MDKKKIKFAIDQIEVPKEEVLNAIDRGIKKSSFSKIKRNSPKKKIMIGSIVVASFIGITLFSGFVSPNMNRVLASAPLIGGLYQEFGDEMGLELAKNNLITELNQEITKNGVTVKLNNVYFDGNVVSIIGHVSGKIKQDEVSFDVNFENNKGDNDPWLSDKSTAIKKTEKGYDFQWKLAYPYKKIKENFTLPITIHNINGIKGSWNFNIPITQEKNKMLVINHSKTYQNEGIQINVNEVNLAQASSTIVFEIVSNYKDDQIDFYKAIDDKGNELFNYENNTKLSYSKDEDGYHLTLRKKMKNVDKDAHSITFYPFKKISDPPVQKLLNTSSFILKSERTELEIKVNSVTEEGNKLILDYQFRGLPGDLSTDHFDILVNNLSYSFNLIDEDFFDKINPENPILPKNHSISRNDLKLLDKETYHFQSIFHLNGENKIENFSLQDTLLQFDFTNFIETKELEPFTIYLPK